MKAAELRSQNTEELKRLLQQLKEELFGLRFQHTLGNLEDTSTLKRVRRDIARIQTILRERELGIR